MKIKSITCVSFVVFLFIFRSLSLIPSSFASGPVSGRPNPSKAPVFAQWLLRWARWGVLSTLNSTTGVPLFFITTTLDPIGAFAVADPCSSLTVSDMEVSTCDPAFTDPQSPACAKFVRLSKKLNKTMAALAAIYASHPQFLGFAMLAGFEVFKMDIRRVFLVNDFQPSKNMNLREYFAVE